MAQKGQLQFSYDNYDEDFHTESPKKNEFSMQTNPQQKQKTQQKDIPRQKEQNQNIDFSTLHQKSQISNPTKESSNHRQKMIEQNIKLKTQIYELAKQMDDIMSKEKKHKKYGINADQEEDEAVKAKKIELKKQQVEIMQLKNKIFMTKRQLEHVYDSRGIQGKQDQLKSLQKELKALQDEKDALLKVKKEQTKALKLIRNDHQFQEKIIKLRQQLSKIKEECKNLSEKLVENQRILRKNHEQHITKQNRIKEMQIKIKESKEKAKKGVHQNIVTVEMISEIEQQINELETERKQSQKSWNDKIHNIEAQLQQRRIEQEKKLLILKQKEKQLKLNEIRIKELRKLIQHHQSEISGQNKKQQNETDMKEFRHKRNIKYLDK